ncbi:MAG: hypothetical protein AUJ57_01805 [Zetaproteobacteria bacterium CG1_02_53_45]|nr:MAG: hypothetical protein AUJ57_01805 [Zetaproteobacteria bacterium CG1_02_53_45]
MQQGEQHSRETGAALIIVLGLVALISSWAVSAAYDDTLALRRAENSRDALRAEQASQSMLWLSVKVLRGDARESQRDDLEEIWAQQTTAFPIDDGNVAGVIVDSNRFINLNTLVDNNGVVVAEVEKQVKTLFTGLELDTQLVDALIDWLDADDRPHGAGGGEDSSYYDMDYRVKNARMNRWGELLLVRGFDAEVVNLLATVAVAGPVAANGFSAVNINTAGADVLMAMFPAMNGSDAEMFMADRPYDNVGQALLGKTWAAGVSPANLSVVSDSFMLRTQASFGRVVLGENYMLHREAGKITLLSSERAAFLPAVTVEAKL